MSRSVAAAAAGPIVSGLCLIHCVGAAVLAPLLPGVLGLTAGTTWLEPVLWVVSVIVSGFGLRSGHAKKEAVVVWIAAGVLGAVGIAMDAEIVGRVSLGAIVTVQVATAARRWRTHRTSCAACGGCGEGSRT